MLLLAHEMSWLDTRDDILITELEASIWKEVAKMQLILQKNFSVCLRTLF